MSKPAPVARATLTTEKCAYCKGPIEVVGKDRNQRDRRACVACGRDPDASITTPVTMVAGAAPAKKCTVAGCPGERDDVGGCACCNARAAFIAANVPKRQCKICHGQINSPRKFCVACRPVASKIAALQSKKQEEQRA